MEAKWDIKEISTLMIAYGILIHFIEKRISWTQRLASPLMTMMWTCGHRALETVLYIPRLEPQFFRQFGWGQTMRAFVDGDRQFCVEFLSCPASDVYLWTPTHYSSWQGQILQPAVNRNISDYRYTDKWYYTRISRVMWQHSEIPKAMIYPPCQINFKCTWPYCAQPSKFFGNERR